MARLRATVVPVTESSDPSATLFPPPPLSQELLFYAPVLPLPRPLLLILPPLPLPAPLTCCRPRSPARSQLSNLPNNVTSDNVASPISQHRQAFASPRLELATPPRQAPTPCSPPDPAPTPPLSARLSYRYHSTTCTRRYRRQPLFHRLNAKATIFLVSSFRTRGVSSLLER